jgi:hypothetical protein
MRHVPANQFGLDTENWLGEIDVSEFPQLEYSKKDVVRAGNALKERMVWTPDSAAEIQRVFSIANSWRASHAFPMHRLRAEMHGRMSALKVKGLTAARLKQMASIRAKLGRIDSNLRQLQDLGGCRAVLPTIDEARRLVAEMINCSPHNLKSEDPYMDAPRSSGYRSHHLIFAFVPRDASESGYEGRLIEMQIRSRLQHSWATAVEAVGLYRSENLKAGLGSADWLRLFELMSREFAASEGCDYAKDGSNSRIEEIIALEKSLNVVRTLDGLSHAASSLDWIDHGRDAKPRYCVIIYDRKERKVEVKHLYTPAVIEANLETAENSGADQNRYSTVVVEMDSIENLREAYPNYFGDVQLFKSRLMAVVRGEPVTEYSLPPRVRVPPAPKAVPDDSWFRFPNRRGRRWKE